MKTSIAELYRNPDAIFSAADREEVVVERLGIEYSLRRKSGSRGTLFGCLSGSIKRDDGKPAVAWKAAN